MPKKGEEEAISTTRKMVDVVYAVLKSDACEAWQGRVPCVESMACAPAIHTVSAACFGHDSESKWWVGMGGRRIGVIVAYSKALEER